MVVITDTLRNMFPVIKQSLTKPLSRFDFDREVLVPECATALIQQDLGEGTSFEVARNVLRKSSRYGTAMFPDIGEDRAESKDTIKANKQRIAEARADAKKKRA